MFRLLLSLLLVALCVFSPAARALDPAIGLDGYHHDRWTEQEGAPRFADALAQTEDGWLWIAGRQSGLTRFDGVRFHPYESADGSRPQGPNISVLRPGPGGALWIGHGSGGVSVLRRGAFRHLLAPDQTRSVYANAIAADGTAWVASKRGLFHIAGDQVKRVGAERDYPSERAEYVLADRAGRIWAADGIALYLLAPGEKRFTRVRDVRADPMLLEARDGSVWLVLGKQFERVAPATAPVLPASRGRSSSFQSLFDADGNLWSGNCPVGVCALRQADWQAAASFSPLGAAERFDQPWQMTSMTVLSMMEDGDRSIWIGTPAGVERLRDQAVHLVPRLFDRGTAHAALQADGSILAVQVRRLDDTAWLTRIAGGRAGDLPNPLGIRALARAPDGTVVVAGLRGIERHGPGGVQRIPLPPVSAQDQSSARIRKVMAGNEDIWLWFGRLGTWHYRDGHWTGPAGSLADDVQAVVADAAGRTYQGYPGNRLRVADGAAVREYGAADGLAVGRFHHIEPGEPLLVSGLAGTQVLAGGRFRDLQAAVPGGLGPISGIVATAGGTRWINAQRGIYRVAAQDWARTMADPALPLRGTLYDALDGYLGGAESGGLSNTAFAAPGGRLWFVGERGMAWIDPADRSVDPAANPATPDVAILSLSAAGRRHLPAATVRLAEGTGDVQIDYTTPSLRMPQRVTFRYRLGGEEAWQDAGTRRTAYFQRLGPGEHTFEVMAINESGVASRVTALRFSIAPTLTQTWWFYPACGVAALLAVALAHRLRMRQLAARIEDRLLVRVRERESIARSLHDTFQQSVQGMLLSLHSVMMKLPEGSPVRAEFERVLQRAEHVLVEGRDEVKGLRGEFATAQAFWEALLRDVELAVPRASSRVTPAGQETVGQLHAPLRRDVYAIVREALTNALRHTAGPVAVQATATGRAFTLSVIDRGPGMGSHAGGKPGHFGLPGMREGAAQIGARLHIHSGQAGTRVTLVIPAGLAYAGTAEDAAVEK
jgi:signal transduction histidine kinase/ligand-binding sensor domain-containing protein